MTRDASVRDEVVREEETDFKFTSAAVYIPIMSSPDRHRGLNISRYVEPSSCLLFVLMRSRKSHVDFSSTKHNVIGACCQRRQRIPDHSVTERGCDTKVSEQSRPFQEQSWTYLVGTEI